MAYVVQALLNRPAMEQSQFPISSPEDQLLTRYTKNRVRSAGRCLAVRSPTQRFQRVEGSEVERTDAQRASRPVRSV
jgi:hypothetical protein